MTTVLLALFGAMIVGETLRPPVNRLSKHVGRPAAMAIVFGGFFAVLAVLALVPLRMLVPQIIALSSELPRFVSIASGILHQAPGLLKDPLGLGPAFSTLSLTLVMALFWLGASTPLTAFTLSLLPLPRRADAASVFSEIGAKLGAYVSGTLVNAAIVAVLCIAGLLALHAHYAVALGLLAGLLVGVPYLGTFIAMVTVFFAVGGAAQSWLKGAEAAALIVFVHSVVGSFVAPLIFKKHVDVDPLGCVVATAAGGVLFGIPGIVLAVPAASVIKTLVVRVAAPAIRRRSAAPDLT
jgi:predicted PurR-regulated permease PerM